ncbi:hypothetical protein GCM10020360_17450 [Nonlabens tegetincola]
METLERGLRHRLKTVKLRHQLRLELLEIAAGDHRNRRAVEQPGKDIEHALGNRGLRRGERIVKIERDQAGK